MNVGGSCNASGNGSVPRTAGGSRITSSLGCNRCRKPLSTTVFVCSCDCVFCEECTYTHFNDSSRCPCCSKSLGATDFMELVVADPSSATEETLKNTFQTIFTKFSPNSSALSHQEMCSRLLKSYDNERRIIRFLLKQFVFDVSSQGQRSGNMARAYEQLKKEYTTLKQGSSSQRIQFEQTIADLQHRVQALNGTVQELQKRVDDKETQIIQFRHLCAAEGMARVPSSSHSNGSGGKRGGSGGGEPSYRQLVNGLNTSRPIVSSSSAHNMSSRTSPVPPMQSFVIQKQAREQAKAQAIGEMTRARVIPLGTNQQLHHDNSNRMHHDVDSVITPIQVPQSSSHRGGMNQSSTGSGIPPSTPRIRDISASSGYVFTSRNRVSTSGHVNYDTSQSHKRNRSISPGQQQQQQYAFSRNGGRPGNQQRPFGGF